MNAEKCQVLLKCHVLYKQSSSFFPVASSKQSQANKQIKQMQENVQHGGKKERGQQYMQAGYSGLFLRATYMAEIQRLRFTEIMEALSRWQVNTAEAGCDLFHCRGEEAAFANWHGEAEAPPTTHLWHLVGGGQTVSGRILSPKRNRGCCQVPLWRKVGQSVFIFE